MPNTGALINLENPEDGDVFWTATQQEPGDEYEQGLGRYEYPVNWAFGPVVNKGKYKAETYELTITPSYAGIEVGTITGNLKDGLGVNLNLLAVKGKQLWYLKNGCELWTHIDVKITFDGHFEGDYKLFTV